MKVKPRLHGNASHTLAEPQLEAVSELFGVLSEPTRLRILQRLERGPATVTEIVEGLGIKQANASKQLGILHGAGVVSRQKRGNQVVYSIRMPLIFELCELVCRGIREEAEAAAKALR